MKFNLFLLIQFSIILTIVSAQEQQWQEPLEKADLLLFSTHADDEHLFYAGILPYCVANDIKAQVVYITDHSDYPLRQRERLDGLWAVGIRNKPVVGAFPDLWAESLDEAIAVYGKRGFSEDDFIEFCVINIRMFKPLVAVGHDINGEYGHGGHMLSSRALMQAVVLAADHTYHAESVAAYGTWDTPKTYINLWGERKIALDIDTPLEYFDGKTAFQVSQYGFTFHKSQHWTWFYRWLYGTPELPVTMSLQIRTYRPGQFGLYRTLVGDDTIYLGDFFENVVLQKDQKLFEKQQEEILGILLNEYLTANKSPKGLSITTIFGIILLCAGIILATVLIIHKKLRK